MISNGFRVGTGDDLSLAVHQGPVSAGRPVLLLHGLGTSAAMTWEATGWVHALEAAGYGWIAPDLRGHGDSDKPHEPSRYRLTRLVEDAVSVLDSAGVAAVDVVGYSLGARIAAAFAATWPNRVRRVVLGGFGDRPGASPIHQLLDHLPAGSDRDAVAACFEGASACDADSVATGLRAPVLLVAGDADTFAGSIESFAARLADARTERLSGRSHFTALSAARFKEVAIEFLAAES